MSLGVNKKVTNHFCRTLIRNCQTKYAIPKKNLLVTVELFDVSTRRKKNQNKIPKIDSI